MAEIVVVEHQGDEIEPVGGELGRHGILERLHDGAAVTYVLSLTGGPDAASARWGRAEGRFVLSYDLWEEKFSVVHASGARRTAGIARPRPLSKT